MRWVGGGRYVWPTLAWQVGVATARGEISEDELYNIIAMQVGVAIYTMRGDMWVWLGGRGGYIDLG